MRVWVFLYVMLYSCCLHRNKCVVVDYGDTTYMQELEPGRYYIKKFELKPNLPDGKYVVYSIYDIDSIRNKQLLFVTKYKGGFKNGHSFEYSESNKNVVDKYQYVDGLKQGEFKQLLIQRKDSITLIKGHYINDLKAGKWEYFTIVSKSVSLHKSENYLNGSLHGLSCEYDDTGQLKAILEYKNGVLMSVKNL